MNNYKQSYGYYKISKGCWIAIWNMQAFLVAIFMQQVGSHYVN